MTKSGLLVAQLKKIREVTGLKIDSYEGMARIIKRLKRLLEVG